MPSAPRTVRIKLDIPASKVAPTLEAYTKAYNYVCQVGFDHWLAVGAKPTAPLSRTPLNKLTYIPIRKLFNLPSQLASSVISKALASLKSQRSLVKNGRQQSASCPQSGMVPVGYDDHSYDLFLVDAISTRKRKPTKNQVSILLLTTLEERQQKEDKALQGKTKGKKGFDGQRSLIDLNPCQYHEHYFLGISLWKHSSADLSIRDGQVYLDIVFQGENPEFISNGIFVGGDMGMKYLLTLSNNTFFGTKKFNKIIKRYNKLRSKLQAAAARGSKSAKRHLGELGHREQRFRADVNHQMSKGAIATMSSGTTLCLENLTGITQEKRFSKELNKEIHNWAFAQLRQFLTYKALAKGINVVIVDPAYTSQCCSNCGFCCKQNRKTRDNFNCMECGFALHADLNASRNIGNLGQLGYMPNCRVPVNAPYVENARAKGSRKLPAKTP